MVQDLRHAFRMMVREKGFTAIAVLVLALGIGATTTIFSLVDAALLRPLPFPQSDRLMMIAELTPGPERVRNSVAALNFLDWRDGSKSFESMAAFSWGSVILKTGDTPEQIPSQAVSPSFFDVLGVHPAIGRALEAKDEVVIGHGLWTRRFGGGASIVGRSIILNDQPVTVVGVMPAGFELFANDIWTPLILLPGKATRESHYLRVMGRLKPAFSREDSQTEMDVIANRIAAVSPQTNRGWGASVVPLQEFLVGSDLKSTSLMLMVAVGLILLISCVNVANLLLARRVARAREMVVRASIGAARSRLIRQMLTESALLGICGGVIGIWVAWIAMDAVPSLLPPGTIPAAIRLQMDMRVVLFTVAASLITAVAFGLVPALRVADVSLSGALRAGGRTATGAKRSLGALASVEIALAVVVLAGAGLLIRTLLRLENVDRGYRAGNVLTMHVSAPPSRYPTPARTAAFYRNVERELASVPGVRAIGMAIDLPLEGWSYGSFFELVGAGREPIRQRTGAHLQSVSSHYFEALGIRLLKGRRFGDEDTAQSKPVCIINEALAEQFFADRDPIGARIDINGSPTNPDVREIAGVIGQVKVQGPGEPDAIEIYVPLAQGPPEAAAIALRTDSDPLTLAKAVPAAIHRIDADVPVTQIGTLETIAAASVNRPRMRAGIAGVFAAIGALLASMGIFGVLSYSVSQRTREIGLRMALGAKVSDVFGLVLGEGSRIAATGIGIGLIVAAMLTRYLATMLWGVQAIDPLTFAAVPALFALVALAACAIPARRASRVDPAITLRDE